MAYTINQTSGSVLANVADGTIDNTTTDLTLIGKNYSGYGDALNENFVKLLENFSHTTAPTSPLAGQLWWDSTNNLLKVYTGTTFKTVSSSTASATQPASGVVGDLWWDTANSQLKVYNGASWTLVGPAFSSGSGQSGPVIETITDSLNVDHVCVKIMISDVIVAIVSKDNPSFTPSPAITGFASIGPGYNLSTDIANNKINGTATDSDALGGQSASSYLRSDANDTTSSTLGVLNDTGFTVGADSDLNISVSGDDVTIKNNTANGDLILGINDGGTPKQAITVDGATGEVLVLADPTQTLGVATKNYVDSQLGASGSLSRSGGTSTILGVITPDTDANIDFGSTALKFDTIHAVTFSGRASEANYADLAERFAADNVYTPGTLMALGGAEEITQVNEENTDDVFGVISSRAAYLMNAGAGNNETHPAIAITGRVPVRVIGEVRKGDRIISAGNGLAKAGTPDEITAFNVIGRALENKYDSNEGLVECFVKVN